MFENSNKNKQVVTGSAIVAKAALRRENGRIELIVVYQESTRHEFYWIYTAKNPRSPRRSWKYTGHRARDFNLDPKPYTDFGSFVAHYARFQHAQVLTVRVLHSRRLAALLTKTAHESIHADWTPQDLSRATFEYVNRRAAIGRGERRGFYANKRNKDLDDFPQSQNEVLVFEDWCEECTTKHSYAHFPDGKKMCKIGYSEMKKNPGFDYRGFKPSTGFRFTYRTFTGAGRV